MEKINDIIESIANEKGLPTEDVRERVKIAFIETAKRLYGEDYEYEAVYDGKKIILFQKTIIVGNDDERLEEDGHKFISIKEAKKLDSSAEIGDAISYSLDLENHGRTASNAFAKELNYHIQRLLEEKIFEKYTSKVGSIIFGNVIHIDSEETTFIEFDDFLTQKKSIEILLL